MKPRLLILVTSDPRISPRPAEAVRIAAGIGAWQKVETMLYFHDAAVLALGENAEDLIDGENYVRYLPMLMERGDNVFAQQEAVNRHRINESPQTFVALDNGQLAALVADSTYVTRY